MTASPARPRGFTLLEVMVALAILVGALYVLVDSQAQALITSRESGRILEASMLAREKMGEVLVLVELEGFGDTDLEEEGDFSDFGSASDDGSTSGLEDLDLGDQYADYAWAWTLRKIDLSLGGGGDLGGMTDSLASQGYWGEQATDEEKSEVLGGGSSSMSDKGRDLSDIGFSPDMIGEMLGNYIRELRVVVWWGDAEDGSEQVELVTHVINPSGVVVTGAEGASTSQAGSEEGGSGRSAAGKSGAQGGKSGAQGGSTSMKRGGRSGGSMSSGSSRQGGRP